LSNFLNTRRSWSDQRILTLVALGTLIVSLVWRLPDEAAYVGQRLGELLFALTLTMAVTYILRPAVRAVIHLPGFGDTHRGRTLATSVVFLACCGLFWLVALVGLRPLTRDFRSLINSFWPATPAARMQLVAHWKDSLQAAIAPYRDFLPTQNFDDPKYLSHQASAIAYQVGDVLRQQSQHAGFLVELFLIPVLSFYFLSDGPSIRREVKLLVPTAWRSRAARIARHCDFVLDGYVRGQAWMCVIAWVLTTAVLSVLQVPHAVALGLFAGVTRAVPVIGPMMGAIPLVFVTLIYTQSVDTTLLLVGAFTLMHLFESKVLLPKIVGHHVDLHPVSVIISLLIGMEFFGIIGVFLAVPIAAVVKIALVEWYAEQDGRNLEPERESSSAATNPIPPAVNGYAANGSTHGAGVGRSVEDLLELGETGGQIAS